VVWAGAATFTGANRPNPKQQQALNLIAAITVWTGALPSLHSQPVAAAG
jgi:hypothetical protein